MRIAAFTICGWLLPSICIAATFSFSSPQSMVSVATKAHDGLTNTTEMDSQTAAIGTLMSASEIPSITWGRSTATQQFTLSDTGVTASGETFAQTFTGFRQNYFSNAKADTTFLLNFTLANSVDVIFDFDLLGWSGGQPFGYAVTTDLRLTGNSIDLHFSTTSFFFPDDQNGSRYEKRQVGTQQLSLTAGDYTLSVSEHLVATTRFFASELDGHVGTEFEVSLQIVPEPASIWLALIALTYLGKRWLGAARLQRV